MAEESCCGCVSLNVDNENDMGLHIPQCKTNSVIMEAIGAFAYGVVIATGLIHMINEGIEKLSDPCLGSIVEEYESIGLAVVLITLMLMHFIECESSVFFGAEGSMLHGGHGHGHAGPIDQETVATQHGVVTPGSAGSQYYEKTPDRPTNDLKIRRKLATIIFEAGVIFHSAFTSFSRVLLSEPPALNSVESKSKLFLLNFMFASTTPLGQVIGIGVRNTYSASSSTSLWVQGTLDCVAGGILPYTGPVELLTYNMTTNGQFLSRPTSQRFALYICLWLGASAMALIGKWA
ncbi:unnamed protein product [Peronospora destructor]|uniref:Uncharacterized protein n=1 Tax=Peronospora destructor TaxID=86335 RepID=A0AAV0V6E2_9STRA|nr:unnamed protein product [Peronospora destructor]